MKWEIGFFKIIFAILALAAIVILIIVVFWKVSLGDELEKLDAEIVELEKKNYDLQKEKDLAIAKKEKEIEKLMASKAEQLFCLSLRELVFSEEIHYKRLLNSLLHLPSLDLRKYLVRQFQL